MYWKKIVITMLFAIGAVLAVFMFAKKPVCILEKAHADEFTQADLNRWEKEYMSVVNEGRRLWTSPEIGTNGVACAQCHPNAANTHPETYPKFQKQLGRVMPLRDMINWCIMNPLEGKSLSADDRKMVSLEAYIAYERRGVPMAPGKH